MRSSKLDEHVGPTPWTDKISVIKKDVDESKMESLNQSVLDLNDRVSFDPYDKTDKNLYMKKNKDGNSSENDGDPFQNYEEFGENQNRSSIYSSDGFCMSTNALEEARLQA